MSQRSVPYPVEMQYQGWLSPAPRGTLLHHEEVSEPPGECSQHRNKPQLKRYQQHKLQARYISVAGMLATKPTVKHSRVPCRMRVDLPLHKVFLQDTALQPPSIGSGGMPHPAADVSPIEYLLQCIPSPEHQGLDLDSALLDSDLLVSIQHNELKPSSCTHSCFSSSVTTCTRRCCVAEQKFLETYIFRYRSPSRNPASEAIPRIQLPRSLDEITQLHSLMGVSLSCMGKHSSVPSTSQCPERASKVVLRKDARLSFPGEKVPGEKGGRVSSCVAGCCCQLHGDTHDTNINFPSTTWVKPDQQQEHKGAVPGEATALANETNLGKARDQGKHDIFPQYTALQQPVIRRLPEPKVGFGYSTALRILMKENELWT
ncbi:hypothetical protein Anapl_14393 [Anas platyrhynchos]|uniref:Uncharacterized protein n=1 Tax=Anas platyrhynchos TaxID=8839 RepID=R0L8P2_ANAPL|nr:hypothetical protein Anapl_14393 [Anas platyrhynchos]